MRPPFDRLARALTVPFSCLRPWLAKLRLGRHSAIPPPPETPTDDPTPEVQDVESVPTRISLMQRVSTIFRFRRATAPEPAAAEADIAAPGTDEDRAESPAAPTGWLLKLKSLVRFRRRSAPADEPDGTDAHRKADQAKRSRDEPEADADVENVPPRPGLLKRLIPVLARKRVWIPAVSFAVLGMAGGVAWLAIQSSHDKKQLEAELAAVKKKLAQIPKSAPVAVVPPVSAPPAPPTPTPDPAFEIVGHKPIHESASGVDESDCVVADREQVAKNLKRCIEGFNAAVGLTPNEPRK